MNDRPDLDRNPRLHKQQVAEILRKAGYGEAADQALKGLPDDVDKGQAERFCAKYGIYPSDLFTRMGGSP